MAVSFLGLRTCIYRVPELADATKWYSNALGIKPYFDTPYYVGFNIGGYELGLHPLSDLAEVTTIIGENIETYWGVEDIQATFAHLIKAGATVHELPNDVGEGIWVATVKDPWNNILGIIQNPHFKIQ